MVRHQVVMGYERIIDINHLAIWELIDRYHIPDSVKVFERVLMLSRHWINRLNNKGNDG